MGTTREYFELDFEHTIRTRISIKSDNDVLEGFVCYDFVANVSFLSLYHESPNLTQDEILGFLYYIQKNFSRVLEFSSNIVLPSTRTNHGTQVLIENKNPISITLTFPGERPIHTSELRFYGRIFLYLETDLQPNEIEYLGKRAKEIGFHLQIRDKQFTRSRSIIEKPMAFISHDSRDKNQIVRSIAQKLRGFGCNVWYDEYSLKIGDNLRTSIENGLKECKKCILVISPNFLSNQGWTKTEFETIFTRQILEQESLVLPVWHNVDKRDVYEYSPSLLNILGANTADGEDNVCSQLAKVILGNS